MKKILLSFIALTFLCSSVYATSLDTTQAKVKWTAYKTAQKIAVSGSFSDIKYKFKKGSTIAGILDGASASISPLSVDLGDDIKNNNVKNHFFAKFNKQESIKVTFKNVVEGDNQGSILATVKMNGKNIKVPMQYAIKDGMFEAKGIIDITEFGTLEAFKSLATFCHDLHEGLTWTQVEISFSAPVQ